MVLSPGVKRPGSKADYSLPTSADDKKMWIYTSAPPCVLMMCLIKHRENFAVYLILHVCFPVCSLWNSMRLYQLTLLRYACVSWERRILHEMPLASYRAVELVVTGTITFGWACVASSDKFLSRSVLTFRRLSCYCPWSSNRTQLTDSLNQST
jgi:hypothetical protein